METIPEIDARTCEPSQRLTGTRTMFLYSMNDEKLKEKWPVAKGEVET